MKMVKFTLLGVVLSMFVVVPFSARAYVLEPYYWKNGVGNLTYKWGDRLKTSGTVIRNAFEDALYDWYWTPTKVKFSYNSSSKNTLNSYYLNDSTEYGVTTINHTGSSINYFTAKVNAGNSETSTKNVARSAAGHELGHGIGLDHSSSKAIMNSSRDRTKVYVPQTDDINGVNARY